MTIPAAIAPTLPAAHADASARRIAIVTVAYISIVLAAAIYPQVSPLRNHWNVLLQPSEHAAVAIIGLTWLAVLLASLSRQPDGHLWKLIFLLAVTQRIGVLEFVPNSLVWSLAYVLEALWVAVFVHLLVAFPSGDLRDRFDRIAVGWAYALMAAWSLMQLLLTGEWTIACIPECVRNVFVIWSNDELYQWLRNAITVITVITLLPLVSIAIWRHWRAASAAARRTLLPIVTSLPLLLLLGAADIVSGELDLRPIDEFFSSPAGTIVRLAPQLILPAGLALGIIRARWSRGRIASLIVELGRGVPIGSLRDVLARTLGDPSLQLAFAAPAGPGFVDSSGQPIELPVDDPSRTVTRLERDGELLGILVHDPMIEAEAPGLVDAVGNAARLALENERLAAEVRAQLEEVRASRSRIVEAADAERRRVERDLHDGAQQRLVALAMRLQVARETTPEVSGLLDDATSELQTAITEVRGLARGLHPTILTESGLAAAVDALAERAPIVVTVEIPEIRLPPHIEATAYFVVAEALTNVIRHAAASGAHVSVETAAGQLVISVTDDGRGGADAAAGSGLRGLSDRLAAAGGRLSVDSPARGGTIIRAELPLTAAPTPDREAVVEGQRAAERTAANSRIGAARLSEGITLERARGGRLVSNPAVLLAGITGLIVMAALLAAGLGGQGATMERGVAATFARPFYYDVRSDSGIKLYPGPLDPDKPRQSDRLHVLSAFPRSQEGISIWLVDDVLAGVCDVESTTMKREPGREGLLAYLRAVDRLSVGDPDSVTVDGLPATSVDLSVIGQSSGCTDQAALLLWKDPATKQALWIPDKSPVRLTVVDVDNATVVFEIWNQADLASWIPKAREIVDSVRFFSRPPGDVPSSVPSQL